MTTAGVGGSANRARSVSFLLVTDLDPNSNLNADSTSGPHSDRTPGQHPDQSADPTPPRRPGPTPGGPILYKGDELDAQRGPGLGCFRFQLAVLVVLIVLTPLSVVWNWSPTVSAALLLVVLLLLLITGQTIIFLLRLVAADRRGRRRPLASGTPTVGELEDAAVARTGPDRVAPVDPVAPVVPGVVPRASPSGPHDTA